MKEYQHAKKIYMKEKNLIYTLIRDNYLKQTICCLKGACMKEMREKNNLAKVMA